MQRGSKIKAEEGGCGGENVIKTPQTMRNRRERKTSLNRLFYYFHMKFMIKSFLNDSPSMLLFCQ
jgi:hypothetical protein